MDIAYKLKFTLKDSILMSKANVLIALSTKNGTLPCDGGIYYDGNVQDIVSKKGTNSIVSIRPKKYIYPSNIQTCRKMPFVEEVRNNLADALLVNCSYPCQPIDGSSARRVCSSLKGLSPISTLPICRDKVETQCYLDVVTKAQKDVV